MKVKFFKCMAAFFSLAILATGCTNDDFLKVDDTPMEKDTQFYVSVSIANPAEQSTRANDNTSAGDYDQGTAEEQKINKILFIFYNTAYKYVGNTLITLNEAGDKGTTNGGETVDISTNPINENDPGSVSTIMNVVVPVTVSAGSLKPAYVVAVVNPTSDDGHEQRSFEQFIGLTRKLDELIPYSNTGATKTHNGFTMSNSVYYEEDDINKKPVIAVEIPSDNLFASPTEAASSTSKITIYVERVVAKVNVKLGEGKTWEGINNDNPNNEVSGKSTSGEGNDVTYTLKFNVLAWGLSNVEKGSFIVKNYRGSADGNCVGDDFDDSFPLSNRTYGDVNRGLDQLTNPSWNFPGNPSSTTAYWGVSGHRSFWACSPSYFNSSKSIYPSYSDEVVDNDKKEDDDASKIAYALTYRSFNDIYNTAATTPGMGRRGASIGTPLYTLEHTTMPEVVTDQQKRGVTCALIVGQYSIMSNGVEIEVEDKEDNTFYIRNGVTSSGEDINRLFITEEDLKRHILSANNRIFIKNADNTYTALDETVAKTHLENFTISHPGPNITDGKYTPNRYVSLQFDNATKAAGYYLRDANGIYTSITSTNLEAANQALYGLVNGVERYANGYAFFAVPIEHLWTQEKKIGDDKFQAKLGQYGVVRNHFYTISITGLNGIGTAIGDPAVPIIPNVEQEKYYVKTEMYVQRWRVVPQQDVILKP